MKNLKKLFIMSILAISSFVLWGLKTVEAATDAFSLKNTDVICDPKKLDKGSRATCYIVGIPSETGTSVNGYVLRAYTTKYLKLIGAQEIVQNSKAAWTEASSATATPITPTSDMPDTLKTFNCAYDSSSITNVTPTSYGCGVFYTAKDSNDAFIKANILATNDVIKDKVKADVFPNDTYGVIGALIVELDENTVGKECGQICVKTWRVPTAAEYANYSTCTDPTIGCGSDTNLQYKCKEIHYNETGTFTETGAFASYALLAACALIAVSAITLAKKNNKFSRI